MADSNSLLERSLRQHRSGNFIEAAKGYRKFLKKNPAHAQALYLLGCLEYQKNKYDTAIDLLLEAIGVDPAVADYHNALGLALSESKNASDAASSFERAIGLENRAEFQLNLADVLLEANDFAAAASHYAQAATLDSQSGRAWYGGGCAELKRGEFVLAMRCFQKAVDLDPDWLQARHNLARALYEIGQVSAALSHFQKCGPQPKEASAASRAMMATIVPGVPEADNQSILDVRRFWAEKDLPDQPIQPPILSVHEALRVGYVSSFFQRDNWMKPVWGLINQHNRARFQIHLFSDAPALSIRHGYRPHPTDRFFNTAALSNEAVAALIRESGIDILVDLNGFSNWRRLPLFTLRPSPFIIGWFNMYATTGMMCFDYLIGDENTIPPHEERFYSEKILRVPDASYLTFSVDYPVPPVADPPCLGKTGITFGSLASQYKITNEVIAAWSRILQRTPGSTLLLKNKHLASPATQQFIHGLFRESGVHSERVRLEGPADHYDFLKAYDRIDIALDPFPYNGGTTTTEAIWQGVPIVTFYGDRWAARTSASILRAGGLEEFVAVDVESYIELATRWGCAQDTPDRLASLRRVMRTQVAASSVCDTRRFARAMEELYLSVHLPPCA